MKSELKKAGRTIIKEYRKQSRKNVKRFRR